MTAWLIILLWVAPFLVATGQGNHKGRLAMGIVLGLLLGWLGVVIMLLVQPSEKVKVQQAAERQRIEEAARQRRNGEN